jgi:hypothetical protein
MENNSILGKIADVVGKTAPTLGTIFGTPFAGVGLSLIANAFGVSAKDTTAVLDALQSNPEAVQKLKQIEYDHAEALAKISSEDYKTEVADRQSARQREISLHDYVPTFLALGFLLNYAYMQYYCAAYPNPANDLISARFQDVLIMIISYYFGSSHKGNAGKL